MAYAKGAPEVMLGACRYVLIDGRQVDLDDGGREQILSVARFMASEALRVLGLAYKPLKHDAPVDPEIERDMVFVGLAGMIDPPRLEVKEAVRVCDEAGIKTVMITGDHKLTAVAIAKELNIMKAGRALTGAELDEMSEEEFDSAVEDIEVYARVSPAHKLRVVEALNKRGHVVAMTGDGVNDAPALKKADIGVAMGITGTDVTKEAAAMVLTDDNFASIVSAVEEGRGIFGNIKKYLVYLLSANLGEILLMAAAILLGPFLGLQAGVIPLVAVQILYVNLATDGFPAIALSVDPPDKDIMKARPRRRGESIFSKSVVTYLALAGVWTGVVTLAVFVWSMHSGRPFEEAQSMTFATLILIEFFNAFNCRSFEHSVFKIGIASNRWLLWAIASQIILLAVIIYVPALQGPFNTYSLTLEDWALAIGASATILVVFEIAKLVVRVTRSGSRK
jgi:Ca2+-transporting ATPase